MSREDADATDLRFDPVLWFGCLLGALLAAIAGAAANPADEVDAISKGVIVVAASVTTVIAVVTNRSSNPAQAIFNIAFAPLLTVLICFLLAALWIAPVDSAMPQSRNTFLPATQLVLLFALGWNYIRYYGHKGKNNLGAMDHARHVLRSIAVAYPLAMALAWFVTWSTWLWLGIPAQALLTPRALLIAVAPPAIVNDGAVNVIFLTLAVSTIVGVSYRRRHE